MFFFCRQVYKSTNTREETPDVGTFTAKVGVKKSESNSDTIMTESTTMEVGVPFKALSAKDSTSISSSWQVSCNYVLHHLLPKIGSIYKDYPSNNQMILP